MAALLVALLVASAGASVVERPQHDALVQAGVTPVQKVIQMLTDMMAKGKKEKEDEQVSFATFKQFCKSTSTEKEEATYEREKEHTDFVKEHADYTASIDSVERAEESIKAGAHHVSLVQQKAVLNNLISFSTVPEASKRIIEAFLQGPSHLETDLMEMEG